MAGRAYLGSNSLNLGDPTNTLGAPIGGACNGEASYSAISTGARVQLVTDDQKVVGETLLGPGTYQKIPDAQPLGTDKPYSATGCVLEFEIEDVPGDLPLTARIVGHDADFAVSSPEVHLDFN